MNIIVNGKAVELEEGSRWFWFPGYEELQALILAYRPSNP